MQLKYDLIIFDCDGTLVDTEYLNNKVTCDLLAEMGFLQYDIAHAMEHFIGKRLKHILDDITAETGFVFPSDTRDRYIARIRESKDDLKAIPGIQDAIALARSAAKEISVVSNGEHRNVMDSLEMTGLKSCFREELIITGAMAPNGKPAPDLFLLAAKKTGSDPAKTLVIEDSAQGVFGGKAAGMTVWGFVGSAHNPATQEARLREAGADLVFDDFIHIKNLLTSGKN